MATTGDCEQTVHKFVVDSFLLGGGGNRLGLDNSFMEEGIVDSTGVLELVRFLEETYGIAVADDEMTAENLDSVRKVSNYVRRKLGA